MRVVRDDVSPGEMVMLHERPVHESPIVPWKITLAYSLRGLTRRAFAEAIGETRDTVLQAELGRQHSVRKHWIRSARFCRFPLRSSQSP